MNKRYIITILLTSLTAIIGNGPHMTDHIGYEPRPEAVSIVKDNIMPKPIMSTLGKNLLDIT